MTDDPLLMAREAREAIAHEYGYDLRRMAAAFAAMNAADATRQIVRLPPRPVRVSVAKPPAVGAGAQPAPSHHLQHHRRQVVGERVGAAERPLAP